MQLQSAIGGSLGNLASLKRPDEHDLLNTACSLQTLKRRLTDARSAAVQAAAEKPEGDLSVPLEWGRILTEDDFERIRCTLLPVVISVSFFSRNASPQNPQNGWGCMSQLGVDPASRCRFWHGPSGFHVGDGRWDRPLSDVSALPNCDNYRMKEAPALAGSCGTRSWWRT